TDVYVCANSLPYIWNGNAYNTAGTYVDTLQSSAACDTVATLVLNITPPITITTNANVCVNALPYIWIGNAYNAAGTYIDTLQSSAACDTVATLVLDITPLITTTTNANVCVNSLPYIWNGNAYNAAGTYSDTLQSSATCDTVATLVLNITPLITTMTNANVCANSLPYIWNGNAYNVAGTYVDTLQSSTA